jgi:hypothetical protein
VSDPYWRGVEDNLRKKLYQYRRFPVDMVLDPFIPIPKAFTLSGYGLVPAEAALGPDNATAISHHYEGVLKSIEDVEGITDNHVSLDEEKTLEHSREAEALLGGIPFRLTGHTFHLGVWDHLSTLLGVENFYYALVDEPELLHAAMERLTEATIAGIEDANRLGIHDDIANLCHCSHTYTDELLPGSGQGKGPKSENCWAFGLAQVFTGASPEMFYEFELPYINRMAKYFGMIYYGCCDKLDNKLERVKAIPNVRKVSCSPWSDRKLFAERIGTELVMSNKPNPAFLAGSAFVEDVVRNDLIETRELAKANNVNLEYLLKDVSTVGKDPSRLTRWGEIAMEVVQG